MQFIRSWIEKPLSTGAVMPSSKALARTMARYVDPKASGPVIELGPGTGPVTEALVAARRRSGAADPGRVRSRLLPAAAHALSGGDRGAGRCLPAAPSARDLLREPAAAVVSGLPLVTKPLRTRLRLISDAMSLLGAGRALRAVHLRDGAADPEGARPASRPSLRTDLDEFPAGARLGLSRALTGSALTCYRWRTCFGAADGHAENPGPSRLDRAPARTTSGWRRWRPKSWR